MNIRFYDEYPVELLIHQLNNLFIFDKEEERIIIDNYKFIYSRIEKNFLFNSNKYYSKNGMVYFNPLHTCQWFIFLYYFSNTLYTLYKEDNKVITVCDKIYNLSKIISGADLYYEVNMPEIFSCDHPVGSVIGRAKFGNHFSFSQGCTIGNNKGVYPVIGEYVSMYSNSKILGNSKIGNNVILAANSYVIDFDIPENSIVFGQFPNLTIKKNNVIK